MERGRAGRFDRPRCIRLAPADNVYVADSRNHRIQMFGSVPVAAHATSWGRVKTMYR